MNGTTPVGGSIRLVSEQVLSDDWYLLRKSPSTIAGGMAPGNGKRAKFTIEAMAPSYCSITSLGSPCC